MLTQGCIIVHKLLTVLGNSGRFWDDGKRANLDLLRSIEADSSDYLLHTGTYSCMMI